MCIRNLKIITRTALFCLATNVFAVDTIFEEKTCADIGFKPKSEAFGNCVIELVNRKNKSQQVKAATAPVIAKQKSISASAPSQEVVAMGDGSEDDSICQKYGFKPATSSYAECRQKIDLAKQQAQQQQAQYDEQKRQYDQQKSEQDRQRRLQASAKLMDLSQRIAGGQNIADAYRGASGLPPLQPPVSPIQTQTYTLPNNRMMTCTTAGGVTNCY
jgi:hypothetical protein